MATRSTTRWWLAALLALAVAMAGCADAGEEEVEADGDPSTTSTTSTTAAVVDDTAATDAAATEPGADSNTDGGEGQTGSGSDTPAPIQAATQTVTVVDPGAEPRQELRLQWEVGDVQVATTSYTQQLVQEIDGLPLGLVPLDPITTLIELQSEVAAFDGEFYTLRQTILSLSFGADTDPNLAAGAQAALDQLVDTFAITQVVSTNGELQSTQLSNLDALDPAVRSTVEQFTTAVATVPLPTEPVGPGAVWTVTQDRVANGLVIESTTTVSLLSVAGSTIDLGLSEAQAVPEGAAIELAPGQEFPVSSWEYDGSGTQQWDLTRMVPSFQSEANSTQSFALPDGTTLDQTIDVSTQSSAD